MGFTSCRKKVPLEFVQVLKHQPAKRYTNR